MKTSSKPDISGATIQRILLFMLVGGLLTSCAGDDACKLTRDVYLHITFRTPVPKTLHDTTLQNLTVYGWANEDSLLYDSASVSKIKLPLDPSADSAIFMMKSGPRTDTLRFRYQRQLHLISYECGFVVFYQLNEVTRFGNFADSFHIINPSVNTDDATNLFLYY